MARKKRPSGGNRPPHRRPNRPSGSVPSNLPTSDLPDLPDRRALEGTMRDMVRSMHGGSAKETPLDRAQDLMYRAFDEPDEDQRIQLAREALEISPDCADAYVLLAEHTRGRKERLSLLERGVAAGERALGQKGFQEAVGHFWGILETRPYMRARLDLALALWTSARRDEAVAHLQDMLRLNPNDNQGVRYTLAGFLLFLDRDDDLARLLEQYADEYSAAWAFTRALLSFRRHGDTIDGRRLLKTASKINKHVPAYLTGRKYPADRGPRSYSLGDEDEALIYIDGFLSGWKSTPGAIAWLRTHDHTRPKPKSEPPPRGPLTLVKKWLHDRLPQSGDEWQAEYRQIPHWIRIAGEPARPWLVVITNRSTDFILAHRIVDQVPSSSLLWDVLVQAMQHPVSSDPSRPHVLEVRQDALWEELRPHLNDIGVALVVPECLDHIEAILKEMNEQMGDKPEPGLLDVPGMRPEQVARYYAAAAAFYRQTPWKKVGYEAAIQVECDRYHSGPWYAVLMGQSGLSLGLAVYESLDLLKKMWSGEYSDEDNAREAVTTTVTFSEEWDFPVPDFDAARKYGWEVARPDAYPEVRHKERGLSSRPPLVWELELMEGCLRAIPEFLGRRKQNDPTREEFTVQVASGELKLALSWVVEEGA